MREFQKNLVTAWTDYAAGRIDAKALKGASAGFGIYQQRDDNAMMRIRRVGGLITTADLRNAAAILKAHDGGYAHLTTRQDIQLHGIPAANVPAALEDCESRASASAAAAATPSATPAPAASRASMPTRSLTSSPTPGSSPTPSTRSTSPTGFPAS